MVKHFYKIDMQQSLQFTNSFLTQHPATSLVLIPIIGAFLLSLPSRITLYFALFACPISFLGTIIFFAGQPESEPIFAIGQDFVFNLRLNFISAYFLIVVGFLWLCNNIYAICYCKTKSIPNYPFFALMNLSIAMTSGLALAHNILTMFLFYEFLSIFTYYLVALDKTPEALESARLYARTLILTSSVPLLLSLLILFAYGGNLNFLDSGALELFNIPEYLVVLSFLGIVFGVAKAALFPLHFWLPRAMVAHTPVSALLHAVAVVKSGIFVLIKMTFFIFGANYLNRLALGNYWLQIPRYLALFTIIYASLIAIKKNSFKKVLAYSTISQLAYISYLVFSFEEAALKVVMFQLIAHAIAKINLFFYAGFMYIKYGIKKVYELEGLGKLDLLASLSFSICALSIMGIPITVGASSKLNMLMFGVQYDWIFLSICVISSVLSCFYFVPILTKIFSPLPKQFPSSKPVSGWILLPMIVIALLTIALAFLPMI